MSLTSLILALFIAPQQYPVKASPFDGLRWQAAAPEVLVGETWYSPVSIDGIPVDEILASCERRWPGKREKRFGEDLVEALVGLGWTGDLSVDLELSLVAGGESVQFHSVAMTEVKRNAIRIAALPTGGPAVSATRSVRTLDAATARSEVKFFEERLADQFAYYRRNTGPRGERVTPLPQQLQELHDSITEPIGVHLLATKLHRVLVSSGDGHASVRAPGSPEHPGDGYLPFLLEDTSGGLVAFAEDRSELIESGAVVKALDGRPVSEWIEAVRPDIARGSPQLVRHRALGILREVDQARRSLGLATEVPLRVTFMGADGAFERIFALSPKRPTYGPWPRDKGMDSPVASRRLAQGLGYLRIAQMDEAVAELRTAMKDLAQTRGLIVDVRGNGGGSRDLLIALAGYLIGPDESALVGNVARYRKSPLFDNDHLAARFMYPASWPEWSARARKAIDELVPDFTPEWTPGNLDEEFSAWHYLVLDRTGHSAEYLYDHPVVLLSDAGSFSATDIFLGALELLPRVTVLGTPSSGGSARTQAFELPVSGIEVRCASMISYRPSGRLYDGRGIEVDHVVLPAPTDFLEAGGDAQLDAATVLLRQALKIGTPNL